MLNKYIQQGMTPKELQKKQLEKRQVMKRQEFEKKKEELRQKLLNPSKRVMSGQVSRKGNTTRKSGLKGGRRTRKNRR